MTVDVLNRGSRFAVRSVSNRHRFPKDPAVLKILYDVVIYDHRGNSVFVEISCEFFSRTRKTRRFRDPGAVFYCRRSVLLPLL